MYRLSMAPRAEGCSASCSLQETKASRSGPWSAADRNSRFEARLRVCLSENARAEKKEARLSVLWPEELVDLCWWSAHGRSDVGGCSGC